MSQSCPYCHASPKISSVRTGVTKNGHFFRKSDGAKLLRYTCNRCGKNFSSATGTLCYWQKKRHLNGRIWQALCSLESQRRVALLNFIDRKTVARKFLFLSALAETAFKSLNLLYTPSVCVEFDDLETAEHTKLKPVSVTLAVEFKTRRILGFEVAAMPAKGRLAELSIRKFGRREDQRKVARDILFSFINPMIAEGALIKSDMNPHYLPDVKNHFPKSRHNVYKGRRARPGGFGELKVGGFDPLFTLNHTCAMLRANVNRLSRKTWCTTKKMANLRAHLYLYAYFHNHVLRIKPQLKANALRNLHQICS